MALDKFTNDTGIQYFWNRLKTIFVTVTNFNDGLNLKVDKIPGMGLSTNDFSNGDKNKLDLIESGAEVNVIDGVLVNGSSQLVTNKTVNIYVPTKTSDLTNDSSFTTPQAVSVQIAESLSGITGIRFEKVDVLPVTGASGTIYLVSRPAPNLDNVYDEWYFFDGVWETIGSTSVDLSNAWGKTELVPLTTAEIDAIMV